MIKAYIDRYKETRTQLKETIEIVAFFPEVKDRYITKQRRLRQLLTALENKILNY